MGKHREPEQPEENGVSHYPASGEEGGVGKRLVHTPPGIALAKCGDLGHNQLFNLPVRAGILSPPAALG